MTIDGRKVSARNYAAQVSRALRDWAAMLKESTPMDAVQMQWLAAEIDDSIHFASPDDGYIFDDDLDALQGVDLFLPYPKITLEYYVNYNKESLTGKGNVYSPRRLLYLEELSRSVFEENKKRFLAKKPFVCGFPDIDHLEGDSFIFLSGACMAGEMWAPLIWTYAFQCCGWKVTEATELTTSGAYGILLPEQASKILREYGTEQTREIMRIDIVPELRAALEFIEAMSCSNIVEKTHERAAKPNVNSRRIKEGKTPIHETRILTIDPTWLERYTRPRSGNVGTGRKSPKFHERRSHNRRIHKGKENQRVIRIPKMNVGTIEHGSIAKVYEIISKSSRRKDDDRDSE